jgi:hypothetical protein
MNTMSGSRTKSSEPVSPSVVLSCCHRLKMRWIHTLAIPAEMVNL